MPRAIDAGTLNVGNGLAADDSIEANALVHPTGGNDGLRVHILDPSRAHMAEAIGVLDTANNFTSDETEGALAELASAGASGRNNGVVEGGTWTDLGPVITLDSPTTIRIGGTDQDYSGQFTALPDGTNYLYIDVSTGTLTSSFTPPTLVSEDVLLARIVVVAGSVASSTDARFFVYNLDRKLPLVIRSEGVSGNTRSEANFVTLEAALLYLELYAGVGSTEAETYHIVVRGDHVVLATVLLPVDGIRFEGGGDASFTTGAVLGPMFDLNGKDSITFRDLRMVCDHTGSTAITDAGGHSDRLTLDDVHIRNGAGDWLDAVSLTDASSPNVNHIFRDTEIESTSKGIEIERTIHCLVDNCTLRGLPSGGGTSVAVGIELNRLTFIVPGEGRDIIRDCSIDGYNRGIWIKTENTVIRGCNLKNQYEGITVHADGTGASITECSVVLDPTDGPLPLEGGTRGIVIVGGHSKVRGCYVSNPRGAWTASLEVPAGITLSGVSSSAVNCTVEGFLKTATGPVYTGYGIRVSSARCIIDDCSIEGAEFGVFGTSSSNDSKFMGTRVSEVITGIFVNGDGCQVDNCTVTVSSTLGLTGIHLFAGNNCQVGNSVVTTARVDSSYGTTDTPRGIWLENTADDCAVANCRVSGFFTTVFGGSLDRGLCVDVDGGDRARISGVNGSGSDIGIKVASSAGGTKISDCDLRDLRLGIDSNDDETMIDNCRIVLSTTRALTAVQLSIGTDNSAVSNCYMECPRTVWGVEDPIGVSVNADKVRVIGNTIKGFFGTDFTRGYGVWVGINKDDVAVQSNRIEGCAHGVDLTWGGHNLKVTGNTILGENEAEWAVRIKGFDTTNNRVTRVDISDNIIAGHRSSSILVSGQVQNVNINGNLIDGGLGDAVQVTSPGIDIAAVSDDFPSYLTVSNNTIWNCVGGIRVLGTLNSNPSQITIDGNVVHHIASNVPPHFFSFNGAGGIGIGADYALDLTISNNQIHNLGVMVNEDGTTYAPAGPNYSVQGIYCLNCERIAIDGNNINTMIPGGTGVARGIAVRAQGSTVPFFQLFSGISITGNTISDPLLAIAAGTSVGDAIFLDADDSVFGLWGRILQSVAITGNTVSGLDGGIVLTAWLTGHFRTVTISGNTITGNTGNAIQLMTGDTRGTFEVLGIDNNSISGTGVHGVLVDVSSSGEDSYDLNIRDNSISETSVSGISVISPGGAGVPELQNVEISGNTVYDWGQLVTQASSVAIVVTGTSTATLTIGGLGLTATAGARTPGSNDYNGTGGTAAIATSIKDAINDGANGFGAIATAVVLGTTVLLSAVPIGTLGNAVTFTTSDPLDVRIEIDTGFFFGGRNAGALTAGIVVDQRGDILNLMVRGNQVWSKKDVGGIGPAYKFRMTPPSAGSPRLFNFSVVGNVAMGGYVSGTDDANPGFVFEFSGAENNAFGFHDNQAIQCNVGLDLDSGSDSKTMKGIAMSGNIMRGNYTSAPVINDVVISGSNWTDGSWNGLNMQGNIAQDGTNDWGTAESTFGGAQKAAIVTNLDGVV